MWHRPQAAAPHHSTAVCKHTSAASQPASQAAGRTDGMGQRREEALRLASQRQAAIPAIHPVQRGACAQFQDAEHCWSASLKGVAAEDLGPGKSRSCCAAAGAPSAASPTHDGRSSLRCRHGSTGICGSVGAPSGGASWRKLSRERRKSCGTAPRSISFQLESQSTAWAAWVGERGCVGAEGPDAPRMCDGTRLRLSTPAFAVGAAVHGFALQRTHPPHATTGPPSQPAPRTAGRRCAAAGRQTPAAGWAPARHVGVQRSAAQWAVRGLPGSSRPASPADPDQSAQQGSTSGIPGPPGGTPVTQRWPPRRRPFEGSSAQTAQR